VIPALFKFVAIPLLWNYRLTEDRVQEIQAGIARGADPGPAAVPGAR
jgi:hypothetical protein